MIHSNHQSSSLNNFVDVILPAADHFQPYLIALPEMATLCNKSVKYDMI